MTTPKIVMPSQIVMRATASLIGYARNSRTHSPESVQKLADKIRQYGWTQPVLIDGNRGVIAGHGRIMAAELLGLVEVPCIELRHLTDTQKRELVIWDNRSAELSHWSDAMLAQELADLSGVGIEAKDLGFDAAEVDRLMETLGVDFGGKAEGDPDAVPEAPVVPTSKLGDVWLLGKHRVMCGDSTDRAQVERLMDGRKADMVFTDPPYGVDYEGISNDSRKGLTGLLESAFANYAVFAKAGSSVYVFHSDRCADIFHHAFREHFHFSSMCIWVKPSLVLSQTDYQSRHEPCMYGWVKGGAHKWRSDRKQTSVWEFGKETFYDHTTPKPVALVSYAVENSSSETDLVMDLFGGSGSTLMACEKTGREARLMELAPNYVDVIVRRWQDFTGRAATLDDDDRTFAEIAEVRRA
jgi:DNA modification methylase